MVSMSIIKFDLFLINNPLYFKDFVNEGGLWRLSV